jgi:hypothetical protein
MVLKIKGVSVRDIIAAKEWFLCYDSEDLWAGQPFSLVYLYLLIIPGM